MQSKARALIEERGTNKLAISFWKRILSVPGHVSWAPFEI